MLGQREFLMRFFEHFHQEHESLQDLCTFEKGELFQDTYMVEMLSVGLPHEFES